jgi:hypothetical protein
LVEVLKNDFFSETKIAGYFVMAYPLKRGFFEIKERTFKISCKKGRKKMDKVKYFYTL